MSYTKTTWRNNQAPAINADNLNHMEQGIESAHNQIDVNTSNIESLTTQVQNNATNIASEISARQTTDSSLQSQIDQLVAPTGEAPTPAEIENARIGDDGVTYDTLGNAIRGQFSDVKSDLKSAIAIYGGNNLLNYATFTDGKFRNAQDGSFPSNPNYCYSSPIYVKPNTTYKLSTAYHTCFLDADKNFINGVWVNTSFVTPSNCYFIQVSPPIADKSTATLYEVERGDSDSKMFSGNSRNLLTNTVWEDDYAYIYNTNNRTYNSSYSNSGLINVGGNTPIYLHNVSNPHTVFYDSKGDYISGKLDSYFATPSNCVYMRISIPKTDKANALVIRYDREDRIKVGTESDMIPRLNFAHALAQLCNLPIFIYGGEYDIGALFGGYGFNPVNDVIGIGMPKLYVNKSAFDVNLSCFMLNRANKAITIDGFQLEVTNGRYCVHDEEGALSSGQYYKHIIRNCVMKQNTAIQQDFTYPRCIGIGLGNNGHIVIENCYLESNVPEEIDAHTGYNGQAQNSTVFIKDCVMPTGTVSLTDAGVGSGFVDTMVVTNCLVNAEPTASENAKVKMVKYNNAVVQ